MVELRPSLPQLVRALPDVDDRVLVERARFVGLAEFTVGVEELLAPLPVGGDDFVEFVPVIEMNHPFVELFHRAEPPGILERNFAELPAALCFAEHFHHPVKMLGHHGEAFVERWLRQLFAGGQKMHGVPENPRIVKRTAPDADSSAAGLVEHAFGGAWRGDVAVADNRNIFHGLDDSADAGEIHFTGKTLFPGAPVDDDASDANVFECAGEVGCGEVVGVPAEPHFAGDWNLDGVHHRLDEANGFRVVSEQG